MIKIILYTLYLNFDFKTYSCIKYEKFKTKSEIPIVYK